jgi:hypothetical protein
MPAPVALEKAFFVSLDEDDVEDADSKVEVQFNPESLKVAFANQIAQPQGGANQGGTDSQQFVGAGTTKLTAQLWFDVTVHASERDVRALTAKVAAFITPAPTDDDPNKYVPPKVRFAWGTFQFDGIMESLEESLEFFSADGRPLRASVSFSLAQQKIADLTPRAGGRPPGTNDAGRRVMTPTREGGSVQQMAAAQGRGGDWQRIAAANKVENPRAPGPGALLDMNPPRRRGR